MEDACIQAETWAAGLQYRHLTDSGILNFGYDTTEITAGFYIVAVKGNLAYRLGWIGVYEPMQEPLTAAQVALRVIAHVQAPYFDEEGWRAIENDRGAQAWGPERPSRFNGAVCFVTERDAGALKSLVESGQVELKSKHLVVSAEYVPVVCRAMLIAHATRGVPLGNRTRIRRVAEQLMRGACLSEFYWFEDGQPGWQVQYTEAEQHAHAWNLVAGLFENGRIILGGRRPTQFPTSLFASQTAAGDLPIDHDVVREAIALVNYVYDKFEKGQIVIG